MMQAAIAKLKIQQQKRIEHEDRVVAELRKGLTHACIDSEDEDISWSLSTQHQQRVTMALSRGSEGECLSERYSIRVTRGDLRTLTSSMWLNDEVTPGSLGYLLMFDVAFLFYQVINFYFNLISEFCKKENGLRVHTFNSFFYPKLSQSGYSGVRRWTKKVLSIILGFEHTFDLHPL